MDKIIVFCDGGCRGNQSDSNIGGWGVVLTQGQHKKEIYGYQINTTNNQMELTAAIRALEAVKRNTPRPIELHLDSAYVVNGMNDWILGWVTRGWKTKDKKPVKNKELWQRLLELTNQCFNLKFVKVKGHSTNAGNNRADALANIAMDDCARGGS